MRIGVASLWHETNTYSPRPATLDAFRAFEMEHGSSVLDRHARTATVIGGFLDGIDGAEAVGLFSAGAWPSGPAPAGTLDVLLAHLDAALAGAGPLDGILLNLHGAMVTDDCEDAELACAQLVRTHLPNQPIAAVLDLHGNPSAEAVALCDIVIGYDTYPHVDMHTRGVEAATLLRSALAGRELRTFIAKAPLLTSPLAQSTATDPMRSLMARAAVGVAADPRLVRASLLPGFAYADVTRAGFSAIVVADAAADDAASSFAAELAESAMAAGDAWAVRLPDPAAAVTRALRARPPVVLVDVADNIGGGSAGDGTALLVELLRQGATGAVVQIADPEVAQAGAALGPGARIDAAVGGKMDLLHGEPVAVEADIRHISDGEFTSTSTWMTGQQFSLGTTAVLDVAGNTVVVTQHAVPPFHADALTSLGVDLAAARFIVAKGAHAWRAAFEAVAGDVIEVDTPGACPVDLSQLRARRRP